MVGPASGCRTMDAEKRMLKNGLGTGHCLPASIYQGVGWTGEYQE
jgi:hypothetical protein